MPSSVTDVPGSHGPKHSGSVIVPTDVPTHMSATSRGSVLIFLAGGGLVLPARSLSAAAAPDPECVSTTPGVCDTPMANDDEEALADAADDDDDDDDEDDEDDDEDDEDGAAADADVLSSAVLAEDGDGLTEEDAAALSEVCKLDVDVMLEAVDSNEAAVLPLP